MGRLLMKVIVGGCLICLPLDSSQDPLPIVSERQRIQLDSLLQSIEDDLAHEPDNLIVASREAYQYARDLQLPEQMALAIILEGRQHLKKGKLDLALEKLNQGLLISKEINYQRGIGYAKAEIGHLQYQWGDRENGMLALQEAIHIAETNQDTCLLDYSLDKMGAIHLYVGNNEEAIKYFQRKLEIETRQQDVQNIAVTANQLGDALAKAGELEQAFDQYHYALTLARQHASQYGIKDCLSDIGWIEEQRGNLDAALGYYKMAKEIAIQMHHLPSICDQQLRISEVLFHQESYRTSLDEAIVALSIADQLQHRNQKSEAHRLISLNEAKLGRYVQAYHHQISYDRLKDSLAFDSKMQNISELEIRFQIERKEAENARLILERTEHEMIIQKKNANFLIMGIVMVGISIGLIFVLRDYRRKNFLSKKLEKQVLERTQHLLATNQDLEKANKELERFAFIASHDLKEPLRNISGFVGLIERDLERKQYDELSEYISFVQNNTYQMHALIKDVLEYSRSEIIRGESESLNRQFARLQMDLSEEMESKHMLLQLKVEREIRIPVAAYLVIKNLVENGIIYNEDPQPKVLIEANSTAEYVKITISDNGIGIPEVYQDKVFHLFERLHDRGSYAGSGVGLALCKKIVHRLGGEIGVKSSPGDGSRFWFTIPHPV